MRVKEPTGARAHNPIVPRRWHTGISLAGVTVLALGCNGVVVPTGGDDDGGVSSSPLTVELSLDPGDADVAALLGWPEGRVPGAEVRVRRENVDGSIDDPVVETTDADGRAVFTSIYGGVHRVSALKILTTEEAAVVNAPRPLLKAFGAGAKSMGSTQEPFTVTMRPNRTDGMVISEVATVSSSTSGIWHGYLEVYNNSPDVQYVDGMLIGRIPEWTRDWTSRPCSGHAAFSNDPDGLWARLFQRFPGAGNKYAVQPGETVLLALDAIDHSQEEPWMADLSQADFEFRTDVDADNPAVTDLIDAGPRAAGFGGIQFVPGLHGVFLSRPEDNSSLPQARALTVVDDIFVRIPRADVVSVLDPIWNMYPAPASICPMSMHPNFSTLSYVWERRPDAHLLSQQRLPVGTAPGGWTILMDTGSSAVDWFEAERTPDGLPPNM